MTNTNLFSQNVFRGVLDYNYNSNSITCELFLDDEEDFLTAGEAVKLLSSSFLLPKVTKIKNNADKIFGFINYDLQKRFFKNKDKISVSLKNNVMYMETDEDIIAQDFLVYDFDNIKVKRAGNADQERIIGWAVDNKKQSSNLIRVYIETPTFPFSFSDLKSYYLTFEASDWSVLGNDFYIDVIHNLNSSSPNVIIYENYNQEIFLNKIEILSNNILRIFSLEKFRGILKVI